MDANSTLQSFLKNEMELFRTKVSNIGILDIGTIISVNDQGRALVHGSSFIGGKQTIYEDVEVIFPGNDAGTYNAESPGTACLIFIPRSCMVDTTSKNIRFSATPYNKAGVKVMPIGNGVNDKVRTVRTGGGDFGITASLYNVLFSDAGCSISRKDGTASASLDPNGGLHVIQQGDNGTYYKDLVDGEASQTWLSADKDVRWVDTFLSDGSRTFVQSDPNDDEADPLFSMTIGADGMVTVNMAQGITLESKDALVLKGKSVSVVATDGDVGITATNDQDGPGKVTITSDDDTTITTGSGKKFAVNGDNLEVDK